MGKRRRTILSALVALAVSGTIMADNVYAAEYVEGAGNAVNVEQNTIAAGERIVGGWHNMSGVTVSTIDTDITVGGGDYNMVVGGNYTSNTNSVSVSSTTIEINDGTVRQLIGGTGFNSLDGSDNAEGRTTDIVINGGAFGTPNDNTNCPEKHIVAGDLLKTGNEVQTTTSTIDQTKLTINDGTFDAAIYGGSAAIRYYAGYTSGEVKGEVNNASIEINGGTFSDAVAAGGLAWGHHTDSIVKNAEMTICGESGKLTFNSGADIFAGGLDGALGAGYETAKSTVEKATINIDNAKVNNIYGSGGTIDSISTNGQYGWKYQQNTDQDAIVDTTLNLNNVEGNIIDIQKGSIKAEGQNTFDTLKVGQDATLEMTGSGSVLTAEVKAGSASFDMGTSNTWNTKGSSEVGTLSGTNGTIVVDANTIGQTTVAIGDNQSTQTNVVAKGLDLTGGAKNALTGLDEKLKESVSVTTGNSLNYTTGAVDSALRGDVALADGKVTTTMDTDNLVIAGNVQASTFNGIDLEATLKGQSDAITTNNDNSIARDNLLYQYTQDNKAAIEQNTADIKKNAQDIADVNGNLVTAVDNINQNMAEGFNTINKNVADGFNTINGAIDAETTNRIAADNMLSSRIDSVSGRLDKVGAGAAALAALHPLDYDADNKLSFASGVGNYAGSTAMAIGAFYRPSENCMMSLGGSMGNGENMVNLGVSFAIGKGQSPYASMSKKDLVRKVDQMSEEIEQLKAMVAELAAKK